MVIFWSSMTASRINYVSEVVNHSAKITAYIAEVTRFVRSAYEIVISHDSFFVD